MTSTSVRLVTTIVAALVIATFTQLPVAASEHQPATLTADVDFGHTITFSVEAPLSGPTPLGIEVHFGLNDSIVVRRALAEHEVTGNILHATHTWEPGTPIVPGAEIRYQFAIEHTNGEIERTLASTVTYIDTSLPWKRIREGDVEIWYYVGGASIESYARRGIHTALKTMRETFGAKLERETRLILYADINRMRAALGRGTSSWTAGAAIADFNITVLHAPARNRDQRDFAATVAHEITHIILAHRTRNSFGRMPAWLHEGLATTVEMEIDKRFPYAAVMAAAVAHDEFVSLRGITGSFPASGDRALQAYAQSNSLVTYIIDVWGPEGIARLLDKYANGVTDNDAVFAALGMPIEELERKWLGTYRVATPVLTSLARPDATPPRVLSAQVGLPATPLNSGTAITAAASIAILFSSLITWRLYRSRLASRDTGE